MKHAISTCLLLLLSFYSSSQWKTLYEGGIGTPLSLRYDCSPTFMFSPDQSSNQSIVSFNVVDNQNASVMSAYLSPFSSQCELKAGIYKYLPEMGQYTSLRIYLDLELPDSVGTIYYATAPDSTLTNPNTGANNWTDFASNISSTPIYFSNLNGNQTIFLYTLFNISPGNVTYKYLHIEADTTQMLSVSNKINAEFDVFSFGKKLSVKPPIDQTNYTIQLIDFSGNCVYQNQFAGDQELPLNYSAGFYLVVITQNNITYRKKIYLE
ncbi:MAG: T9SS type A sorting domain-containing protein [Fluviicola sp.]|nr:T9SS type A sorting domain-containing protein [Fluviicola sp.]